MTSKKLMIALLAMVMVIGLVPMAVFAAEAAETNVAAIGETQYPSLQEAVEAAEPGDTVTLLSDIVIRDAITFAMKNGVTLDLNGKTVSAKDGKAVFTGAKFTVKNGTFKAIGSKDYYLLTVDSGSTKALRSASEIVIEDLTFVGGGLKIRGGATVTLKDNSITANQNLFKYAVWAYGNANVTILSGQYFGGKNGYDVFAEGNAKINVLGGSYKYLIVDRFIDDDADVGMVKGENGTIGVAHVAAVNGKNFGSVQAAVDAAAAGQTVTLLADITAAEQIVINKSITLDLGKFTITGKSSEAIVRVYSDVADTVIDITVNATNGGIINNGTGYAIYAGEDLDGGAHDAERTNLTINGGNYVSAGTDCIRQIMGKCTINGGSYKSSYGRTVLNGVRWYGSEFAINGGKFYGFNPACVSVWTGFDGKDYTNFYHQHDIIAEGKTAAYADGWYTVVAGTYTAVAETKSLCYPSLEAALDASISLNDIANLGVITLLTDDTLDLDGATITLPKGLVLDLNGHTLTVPYQKALFAGENITIKNGTITTGGLNQYGLYIMGGSFTVENVACTNGINVQAGDVTLKDVTVTNPNNKYYTVYSAGNVTILGGTFKNTSKTHNTLYGNITVYGGTFNKIPNAFVAENEDLHVVKSGSWYTVYEGFQNALDAAVAGDTVYLMSDIMVAETINIDKAITLELGANTITSTAAKNVIYSTADLTVNATTGGITSETARTAILQDNGVCTINGGSFKASGNTGDHANGKPVYNTLVLNNTDFYEGVTGSFVINGGKFYMFNPACMSVNKHDHHNHDQIADGMIATLDADGWFTVTEGVFAYKVVCHPTSPASAHQHCFATREEAELFIELMGDCKWDKIVKI